MLRIKIELVPYGIESKTRVLSEMIISNNGTGNKTWGNYNVKVKNGEGRTYRKTGLNKHNRNQSPWVLVEKAIKKAFYIHG